MDNIELFDEQVNLYLKGKMSAEEEQKFLDDIHRDEEKKSRAKFIAGMISQMRDIKQDIEAANAIKQMPKDAFLAAAGVRRKVGFIKLPDWAKMAVAACAAILLMIPIGIEYSADQSTKLLANTSMISYDLSHVVTRGDSDDSIIQNLQVYIENIQKDDNVKESVKCLDNYYQDLKTNPNSNYTDYQSEISWNLAIGYLKIGDRQKAREMFEDICTEYAGKKIAKDAERYINNLDRIRTIF